MSGALDNSSSPPLYEGVDGNPRGTQTHRIESETQNDEFGTVVTEVTAIVTTRKKYRVQEV